MQYRHYKNGKLYEVIGEARHSETNEVLVVYRALYDCEGYGNEQLWVRPKQMFFEDVLYNGRLVPRFLKVGSE